MLLRNSHCNIILIISFFLILSLPTIDNVFKFSDTFPYKLNENRRLSNFPIFKKPDGKIEKNYLKNYLKLFPKKFDSYYNDHFGLREVVIFISSKILPKTIVNKTRQYTSGKEDWVFLNENGMFNDVMGLKKLSREEINTAVTNLYNNWKSVKRQNISYLFILVPNKQSIYKEYLPGYIYSVFRRRKDKSTTTDQIVNELLSRYPDFPILDLRETFINAKKETKDILYDKTDTHWNGLGMKYAYDEIYKNLRNRNINISKTEFELERHYTNQGGLTRIVNKYPYYYSTKAKIKNPTYKRIDDSKTRNQVNDIIRNKYKINKNLENTVLHSNSINNKVRALIQHDSFFSMKRIQPFLANSFKESLFIWHINSRNRNSCQTQNENIKFYKPDVVIHAMVERFVVKICKRK